MKKLVNELRYYLQDLPRYINELRKQYLLISSEENNKQLEFLENFQKNMSDGLKLLLERNEYHSILDEIRSPSQTLLLENKERYLSAIKQDKWEIDTNLQSKLILKLTEIPILHATKSKEILLHSGIYTAASLWKNNIKTCANAMDIALGLHFHFAFFTHWFILENFSKDFVSIKADYINKSIVSSVDIYKLVLIKNNLDSKVIIPTEKWLIALDDYKRQLFSGRDFLEIKSAYILAYFDGDIDLYNIFASNNFYSKSNLFAPRNEYQFLWEIKIHWDIPSTILMS